MESNTRYKPKWIKRNSNNSKSLKGNTSKNKWMKLQPWTSSTMLQKELKPKLKQRRNKSLTSLTRNSKKWSRSLMQRLTRSLRKTVFKLLPLSSRQRLKLNRYLILMITPQMSRSRLELQVLSRWTKGLKPFRRISLHPRQGFNKEQPNFKTRMKRMKCMILLMRI